MLMYIHYDSSQYNPDMFKPIKNKELMTKPTGGLWGSPVGCEYGWKEWCDDNSFRDCTEDNSFQFSLHHDANILQINSVADLDRLPKVDNIYPMSWVLLDFEKLLENGIDAIQLNLSNDTDKHCLEEGLYFKLYGWDCDSILVMNKDVVVCQQPTT